MSLSSKSLESMSIKQMRDLREELDRRIEKAEQTEAREQILKIARHAKLSVQIAEHVPAPGNGNGGKHATTPAAPLKRTAHIRKAKRKVAVKFANPADKSETWTGRGRMPRWLAAKVKGGAKLDQFALH